MYRRSRFDLHCRNRVALVALIATSGAGCSADGISGPDAEGVSIRLAVGGGVAGVSYSFVIDGQAGVVRGETCTSGCDFQPGQVLVPISSYQLLDLAAHFDAIGFFGMDGVDFGPACCDWFDYVLEYADDRRSATIRGSGGAFPEALLELANRIHAFHHGLIPAIFTDLGPDQWPADPLSIEHIEIDGSLLTLDLTYSGGCAPHSIDFVGWGHFLESEPVQLRALLAHDARDDACDAIISSRRTFDLQPIRQAWQSGYHLTHGTVILRIADPAGGPERSVEYHF